MSVIDFEEKRKRLEKSDKVLIGELIHMHADICTGIDLTKALYDFEGDAGISELNRYEEILATTIKRLKQLSPHID
jgi:hypothetical protein